MPGVPPVQLCPRRCPVWWGRSKGRILWDDHQGLGDGRISPKDGQGIAKSCPYRQRPITLLIVMYKTFAKAMQLRLQPPLMEVISLEQSIFFPLQFMLDNIVMVWETYTAPRPSINPQSFSNCFYTNCMIKCHGKFCLKLCICTHPCGSKQQCILQYIDDSSFLRREENPFIDELVCFLWILTWHQACKLIAINIVHIGLTQSQNVGCGSISYQQYFRKNQTTGPQWSLALPTWYSMLTKCYSPHFGSLSMVREVQTKHFGKSIASLRICSDREKNKKLALAWLGTIAIERRLMAVDPKLTKSSLLCKSIIYAMEPRESNLQVLPRATLHCDGEVHSSWILRGIIKFD